MNKVKIVEIDTQWGKRPRLQFTLDNEKVFNVRIHACTECNFIEWSEASDQEQVVAETVVSDDFVTQLTYAITNGKNRCLPELVAEGVEALKNKT